MTDEAFRGPEHIPERDAEANLLNHLNVDGQHGDASRGEETGVPCSNT